MADENLNDREDQERKGGGVLPSWMSGAANVGGRSAGGGVLSGGGSGSLVARLAAVMTSKGAIFATVLGGMAMGGLVTYNEVNKASVKEKSSAVAFKPGSSASDASPVLGSSGRSPSALDMASQANKGAFGEAQQAAATASEPSASADAKDAAKDELGQSGQAATDPKAQAQQMADAMMKQQGGAPAEENKAPGLQRKFGNMSSGLGGGNRALAGGAGLAGGIGGNFGQVKKLDNSTLRQMSAGSRKAQMSQAKRAANNRASSLSGAVARRLDNMNRAMGGARKDGVESQAALHSTQWDAGQPGGQAITGAGAGSPGGGFSSDEGGGSGNPVNASDANPTTSPETPQAPPTGDGGNVTPYQSMVNMASMLLMASGLLLTITAILAESSSATFGISEGTAAIMYGIATALAAMAMLMGIFIATRHGQGTQGAIVTTGGTLMTGFGVAALAGANLPWWAMALAGVGGMAMGVWGLLK